jgi:hypothetical protein
MRPHHPNSFLSANGYQALMAAFPVGLPTMTFVMLRTMLDSSSFLATALSGSFGSRELEGSTMAMLDHRAAEEESTLSVCPFCTIFTLVLIEQFLGDGVMGFH